MWPVWVAWTGLDVLLDTYFSRLMIINRVTHSNEAKMDSAELEAICRHLYIMHLRCCSRLLLRNDMQCRQEDCCRKPKHCCGGCSASSLKPLQNLTLAMQSLTPLPPPPKQSWQVAASKKAKEKARAQPWPKPFRCPCCKDYRSWWCYRA